MPEATVSEERKQAVLAAYPGPFSAKQLASAEVSAEYIGKARQGDKADHTALARTGAMYEQAEAVDPMNAADWIEGILRAAGIAGTFVPDAMIVTEAGELVSLVARAGAAQGEYDAAVLRAADDGEISPEEAAAIQRQYREQQRRDLAIALSVRRMAEKRQPALKGVR